MDRFVVRKNTWGNYDVICRYTQMLPYIYNDFSTEELAQGAADRLNEQEPPGSLAITKNYSLCEQLAAIPQDEIDDILRVAAQIKKWNRGEPL